MNGSLLATLSLRNSARRPRRSMISAGMVAAGVAAVLLVWSTIAGQRRALMGQAADTLFGALQVHAKGYARASEILPVRPVLTDAAAWRARAMTVPQVHAASMRYKFGALLVAPDSLGGASTVVTVTAFDEAYERGVVPGRFQLLDPGGAPGGAVVAAPLQRALKLQPGHEVSVLAEDAEGQLNGLNATVSGVASALLPTDRAAMWLPLSAAQELLRAQGSCNELALSIDDLEQVDGVRAAVQQALGDQVEVETWKQQLPGLADMVSNMRLSGLIVSLIIALVAAMGVFTTAALNVRDRTREIGTWLALGVRRRTVCAAFVLESAALGVAGAVVGAVVGWVNAVAVARWGLPMKLPGTNVLVDVAPMLSVREVGMVMGLAVSMSVLGALLPALRAARLDPVRALGDE